MEHRQWQPRCERPAGLVRPVRLDPSGLNGPTPGRSRGRAWRRTSRGWWVPASVDGTVVEQRILEQAVRLPTNGALTGWAALRWMGAAYFDGRGDATDGLARLPVPVVLGGWLDIGRDDRIAVSRERFWPHQIINVAGVACAVPERAVFDELRRRPGVREPVVAVEMAIAAGVSTLADVVAYVAGMQGWTGVPRARKVLALVAEQSRSPQESRMRLIWVLDAGLPEPLCNQPVFDLDGRLLGVPDLFDPVAGVVGEYDGIDHTETDNRRSDVTREHRFREAGLEYFSLVRGDIPRRRLVVARMLSTRGRALFLPPEQRRWSLEQPDWWLAREAG